MSAALIYLHKGLSGIHIISKDPELQYGLNPMRPG